MKSLAGEWEGPVTVPGDGRRCQAAKPTHISLRVTSRGKRPSCTKMQEAGNAVGRDKSTTIRSTMLYVDGDQFHADSLLRCGETGRA